MISRLFSSEYVCSLLKTDRLDDFSISAFSLVNQMTTEIPKVNIRIYHWAQWDFTT